MKLVRFGAEGAERPGVLQDGRVVDVADLVRDFDAEFFASGGGAPLLARELAGRNDLPVHDAEEIMRWAAPIARPGKVVCIGLDYGGHAQESGMAVPEEPVVFFKAPSTVVGPYDDVLIPIGGTKTDWEVELGVVIGTTAR